MLLVSSSCHKDHDDYTTTARIGLTLPVEGEVEIIQYSAMLMNLNSRDEVTIAGSTATEIVVPDLLRGAYSINVEGVVTYFDPAHEAQVRPFRAQSQYVPLVDDDNRVEVEVIFMD